MTTTIREPLTIGADPVTGNRRQIPLWTKKGGRVILIAGKKATGKTTLLNSLTERISACPDAQLLTLSPPGFLEVGEARRSLQATVEEIKRRNSSGRPAVTHEPTPEEPLLVVAIDEIDGWSSDPVCQEALTFIASKGRSEGVTVIATTSRATGQHIAELTVSADVVTP